SIVRVVGNRAARSQRHQPCAAAGPNAGIYGVMMNQRCAASAPCAEALSQHSQNVVELLSRQVVIRIGRAHQIEKILLLPLLARGAGNDLLSQQIERFLRDLQFVEFPSANASQRCDALDQLVPAEREQSSLWHAPAAMFRTADTLKECRNGAR